MIQFDKKFVLSLIVTWINDATAEYLNRIYRYIGDDLSKNHEQPSKSYLRGQFYIDYNTNTIYIRYLLDPSTRWHNPAASPSIYGEINRFLQQTALRSFYLLRQFKVECLFDQQSLCEHHEYDSNCRSEETNRILYDDTVSYWKTLNGKYMFIRDSSILLADKNRVYENTGKFDFSDYRAEVKELSNRYNFIHNNHSIPEAFEEYKVIYKSYFNRDLVPFEDSDIVKFCLVDWTDYAIKPDKPDWDKWVNFYPTKEIEETPIGEMK